MAAHVDLAFLHLTSLPEELFHMPNVVSLDLSHNELTALPVSLTALSRLERLSIAFNKLQTLPTLLGRMAALRSLEVEGNPLMEVPTAVREAPADQLPAYMRLYVILASSLAHRSSSFDGDASVTSLPLTKLILLGAETVLCFSLYRVNP
jgi:Leucine-rich repeat (LRR) protein